MIASDLVRRLHQHRVWVNHQLLEAARQLEPGQLQHEFPIGQGSVWKTLTHLWAAECIWLEALYGNESARCPGDLPGKLPGNQEDQDAVTSLDDLECSWRELDRRWDAYLATLDDADLDDTVYRISWSGIRRGTRRGDVLLHVCTHAQYTTAQMINMLRHLGCAELPELMLITLARQEAAQEAL